MEVFTLNEAQSGSCSRLEQPRAILQKPPECLRVAEPNRVCDLLDRLAAGFQKVSCRLNPQCLYGSSWSLSIFP